MLNADDSDDDPETGLGDRPWTKNELRERAQKAILEKAKKKKGPGAAGIKAQTEKLPDPGEDAAGERRTDPLQPPRDYAASTVTSKESGGESGGNTAAASAVTISK